MIKLHFGFWQVRAIRLRHIFRQGFQRQQNCIASISPFILLPRQIFQKEGLGLQRRVFLLLGAGFLLFGSFGCGLGDYGLLLQCLCILLGASPLNG